MIFVFFGSDYGLNLSKAKEEVKKQMIKGGVDNLTKYDGYNNNLSEIVEDCLSLSLFESKKIIFVTNCYFLSTSAKALKGQIKDSQQDYKGFIEYLKSPEESVDLFLVANSDLDSKSEIVTALKEQSANFTNCAEMTLDDYVTYAMRKAKEQRKDIDRKGAEELFNRTSYKENFKVHGNYMLFTNELEKLFLYTDNVREDDVKLLVHKPLEENYSEIIKLLLIKRTSDAISIYKDVRQAGNDVIKILAGLSANLKSYALLKYHFERNSTDNEICSQLSIKNPKSLYFKRKEVQNISYKSLLNSLVELSDIDRDIRFNLDNPDDRMVLFLSLFTRKYLNK